MSDEPTNPESLNDEEVDPGEPIGVLAGFEHGISPGFLTRLRRKIHRRTTAAQVASFSWNVPTLVLLELWRAVIDLLQPKDIKKGQQT